MKQSSRPSYDTMITNTATQHNVTFGDGKNEYQQSLPTLGLLITFFLIDGSVYDVSWIILGSKLYHSYHLMLAS